MKQPHLLNFICKFMWDLALMIMFSHMLLCCSPASVGWSLPLGTPFRTTHLLTRPWPALSCSPPAPTQISCTNWWVATHTHAHSQETELISQSRGMALRLCLNRCIYDIQTINVLVKCRRKASAKYSSLGAITFLQHLFPILLQVMRIHGRKGYVSSVFC